ncbi:MAG: SCO family protein, partial [Candidatus Cybelea sp.]
MRRVLGLFVLLSCAAVAVACSNARSAPDFILRDDGGNPWRLSQQRGSAVLLTFGFTHCADTCPAMLAKLARCTASLHARTNEVEVVFVTIDPRRDTTTVMHRFISRFVQPGESRLVGLTGTPGEIEAVERAYHIWSQHSSSDIAHTA